MKKKLLLLILFSFCSVFSQNKKTNHCGTDYLHLKLLNENIKYKQEFDKTNNNWQVYSEKIRIDRDLKNKTGSNSTQIPTTPIVLNVVFHDMITSGSGMLSSQYQQIVTSINDVFAGNNTGGNNTNIQFCLSSQDMIWQPYEDGSTWHSTSIAQLDKTNFDHINTIVSDSGSQSIVFGFSPSTTHFPVQKYINIYLVDEIIGETAGFAFMPNVMGSEFDGIFIERNAVSTSGLNLTLVHELGHYLGLFHVFGICSPDTITDLNEGIEPNVTNPCSCINDNCLFDGDMVCDTPPSMLYQDDLDCTRNSCSTDNIIISGEPTDVNDAKNNFMDYGNPICINTFTDGQITRMHFMIDPEFGPRKSLIGVSACTDCSALQACSFTLDPSTILEEPRHIIDQVSTGVIPSISFQAVNSVCSIGAGVLTYNWTLERLGSTNVPVTLAPIPTTNSLTLPTNLSYGNYKLSVKVTLASNPSCFVNLSYNFSIFPPTSVCNLNLPIDNSNWTGWNRVSYVGGWSRNLGASNDFTYNTTIRTSLNATTSSSNFEILNPASIDSNFTGVAGLPVTIDRIMRVGAIINETNNLPDGDASYVTIQFNPTRENCKYRVYYLGMTIDPSSNDNVYYPINNHQNQDSWFGLVSRYDFTSPVTTPSSLSSIGNNENGFLLGSASTFTGNNGGQYGLNDMIYGQFNSNFSNSSINNVNGLNYRTMTQWKFVDLDFSEFVDLGTTITLTFFARSNDAVEAKAHSYAYFGIECRGAGLPADYDLFYEDVNNPCEVNENQSCHEIVIENPNYVTNQFINGGDLIWLGQSNLLGSATLELSPDNSAWGAPITLTQLNTDNIYELCQSMFNSPFTYFRITVRTLHKTIVKTIKVVTGFYHQNPPCEVLGPEPIYGGENTLTQPVIICPGASMPTLTPSPPCFPPPPGGYVYQWKKDISTAAVFSSEESYVVNPSDFPTCYGNLKRYVQHLDPYCGTPTWYPSEMFTVYNLGGINYPFSTEQQDICVNDDFTLSINNFNYTGNCIPLSAIDDLPSDDVSITFQLINPLLNSPENLLGAPVIINNPTTQSYNLDLTFNNLVDVTPIYNIGSNHHLVLRITYNVYGCQTSLDYDYYFNVLQSAVAGEIAYNCNAGNIDSLDDGNTGTSTYQWEVASNPSGPYTLISGQNSASITNILGILSSPYPKYVRRMSFAFSSSNCPDIAYSLPIIINPNPAEPIFNFPSLVCKGGTAIPLVTTNGINGTWTQSGLPVTNIQTDTAGIFNYIFTPAITECTNAANYSVPITITDAIEPTFNTIPVVCIGESSPLPTTSNNGITGTWSPAFDSNNSQSYVFTPNPNSSVCHGSVTREVIVLPALQFNISTNYCINDNPVLLPVTDLNGVSGTWLQNENFVTSISTSSVGTLVYIFEPSVAGSFCSNYVLTVNIHASEVEPLFVIPSSICLGSTAPVLPTVDQNGITGIWSPNSVLNHTTASYTFTPSPGQCASTIIKNIEVLPLPCGATISWNSEVSCQINDNDDPRVNDADIVDGPCIRVCENTDVVYTIDVTAGTIDYIDWNITGGNLMNTPTPNSCTIQWNATTFGAIQGIIYLTNGSTLIIDKCIEKVKAPIALFGIMPNNTLTNYSLCIDSPVIFDNLSTSNDGNDTLYYNWDFGDGTSSNEFEPIHIYDTLGNFTVTLSVFNGCSCVATFSINVEVKKGNIPISCQSVACENELATYSIPEEIANNCNIVWEVFGGEIVNTSSDNSQIDVLWNNVDQDGFGYVSIRSNSCVECPTIMKIPVVKSTGTIKGKNLICENTQAVYSLPQWPTTEFNWTINDGGTGASLIFNNQRNEIIVNSGGSGIVQINCSYYNTLLGCGGSASYEIEVKPSVSVTGNFNVCNGINNTYQFVDSFNTNISSINWTITGPDNYTLNGSGSPLNTAFPTAGLYNIAVNSPQYCTNIFNVNVKEAPAAPTNINGPITICPSIPVTYSCLTPSSTTAVWEVTGGIILGSNYGSTITVQFDPSATVPYTLTVRYESELCLSAPYTVTVNVIPPDLTLLQTDSPICGSNIGNYQIANVQADSYNWSIEPETAGSVQSGQNTNNVLVLWNQYSGTATLKLNITKCGIPYEAQYHVQVLTAPIVNLTGDATACTTIPANFSFNLTPTGACEFDYVVWDFGDNTTETIYFDDLPPSASPCSIIHTFDDPLTASATYTVKATVYGAGGCLLSSSDTFDIVVSPSPIITVSPTSVLRFNLGGAIPEDNTYSVNIQSGFCETTVIQWYKNGVAIPGANGAIITITDSPCLGTGVDFYNASVTNSCFCTKFTPSIKVLCDGPGNEDCFFETNIVANAVNTGCQTLKFNRISISDPPSSVYWSDIPVGTLLQNDPYNLIVGDLEPGKYTVNLNARYEVNGQVCVQDEEVTGIVPYKARLKYNVSCGPSATTYSVNILDHSVIYPDQNLSSLSFQFTTNNGGTWTNASEIGGIPQLNVNLVPGTYTIGVKIKLDGYLPCIYYETLVLPAFPTATFTHSLSNCQGSAVTFTPDLIDLESQYMWTFAPGVTNLLPVSSRVFNGAGFFPVTLTVTNKYGCQMMYSKLVNVMPVDIRGTLEKIPISECEGNNITIHFNELGDVPQSITWFHNSVDSPAIATTIAPNLDLTVSESGQYIAYMTDANGCTVNNIVPISVGFIPRPETPVIKGPSVVCAGSEFTISATSNPNAVYNWTLNTVTELDGNGNSITQVLTTPGTYTYQVSTYVPLDGGGVCSSLTASWVVTVIAVPDTPELHITVNNCESYEVLVEVINVQAGVDYYWSNGEVGTQTLMTHDGPIQVRAQASGCSVTTQIDLPIDLQAVSWVFPVGCYTNCDRDPLGYIIGPYGYYNQWTWLENNIVVESGTGHVPQFNMVIPFNNYQLKLKNGYCESTMQDLVMNSTACENCEVSYDLSQVNCIEQNGVLLYEMIVVSYNPYSTTEWATITTPSGNGYFVNSSIPIPPGNQSLTIYFYPLNGFHGGTIPVNLEFMFEEQVRCRTIIDVHFPPCSSGEPRILSTKVRVSDVLLVAPNPARFNTTIYYLYGLASSNAQADNSVKTIDIFDLVGRKVLTLPLNEVKGQIDLDTARFASGQYLIVLKADDNVIKTTKLIISN